MTVDDRLTFLFIHNVVILLFTAGDLNKKCVRCVGKDHYDRLLHRPCPVHKTFTIYLLIYYLLSGNSY